MEPKTASFHIAFVDPLFAVAIHLGFSHRLFDEEWFHLWRPPSGPEVFRLTTFSLGFLTLLLAWIGYHRSISTKPVKGLARFAIDVILVSLYAVLLVKSDNFPAVMLLLVAIYLLYVLWTTFKTFEYPADYPHDIRWALRYRRQLVTFGWFCGFVLLWISQWRLDDWVILIVAFVLTIGHRLNKELAMWSALAKGAKRIFVGH